MPKTVVVKPYDWTYTSTYSGHEECPTIGWRVADPEDPSHAIPIAELTRQDPILFYAEVPLYEDELHDNGSSALLVRIVCFISFDMPMNHDSPPLAGNAIVYIHLVSIYVASG